MTFTYYNEFDPKAALWLWELIEMGMIAPGIVDERSIVDVDWRDLHGFTQCHFFAGIGGWSYALRLTGIPDDTPLWTASLPCQPFSAAGKGLGKQDERHLLPHFLELVKQCKPDTIFGEQVERAIGHGWLDDLQTTMEAESYAVGHCVLGAHSIGAAHIRQRLYWVADSVSNKREQQSHQQSSSVLGAAIQQKECVSGFGDIRTTLDGRRMGISNSPGSQQRIEATSTARYRGSVESTGNSDRRIPDPKSQRRDIHYPENIGETNGEGHAFTDSSDSLNEQSSILHSTGIDWIYCRDNKYRPIEPGIFPLADGVPRGMVHSGDPNATQEARAMRLKGYGNAIVPQVAAEFIRAFYESVL